MNVNSFGNGIVVGLGVGFLNASFFGLPGWMNIVLMCAIGVLSVLTGKSMSAKNAEQPEDSS